MLTKNYKELDDTIRQRIPPYTYNNGEGTVYICVATLCLSRSARRSVDYKEFNDFVCQRIPFIEQL